MNNQLLHILYIEDSPDDAELIDREIRKAGYEIQSRRVESAAETRQALRSQQWDLVISDFALSGFNGFDALNLLKKERLDIPFIMVSGTIGEDVAVEVIKQGAADYVLKDRLRRLGFAVENALDARRIRIKQQRNEEEAHLLAKLSLSIGEAEDIDTALSEVLRLVCETAHWKAGEAWIPNQESQLECSPASYGFDHTLQEFRTKSRGYTFQAGEGVAGSVWTSGKAIWIQDVTTNETFLRAELAGKAGIGSALAIPVLAHREAAAVLMFYVIESRVEDPRMMELVAAVAAQLGALFRRRYAEEALRHAQKMEAIGRLTGGVAHDFNNMLTVIKNSAEELSFALPEDHPQQELVQTIDAACDRSSALVRSMLMFSRKDVVSPQVLDINKIILNLKHSFLRVLDESIILETRLTPARPFIYLDKNRFEQIIMNLVVNARDAMPNGGRITIATDRLPAGHSSAPEIPASTQNKTMIRISIEDTGVGMNETTRMHLFEPFFTTKSEGRGTGLGLSTVYGIVKEGGGDIQCRSEPGQGTCFYICFEEVKQELSQEKEVLSPPRMSTNAAYILLVDDEDAVRRTTERLLAHHGYHVLSAGSVDGALELLEKHQGPEIALLLTDLALPESSGSELAAQIIRMRPEIGVIFCSGYLENNIARDGLGGKPVHFLQKPFEMKTLIELVQEVIDETVSHEPE